MLKTHLGRLRLVGYCEGVSFLALLGIAMPLKYAAGMPEAVLIAGWVHGLLFILYVVAAVQAASVYGWPHRRLACAFVAALLPFGPFVFDWWLRRPEQAKSDPSAPNARSNP